MDYKTWFIFWKYTQALYNLDGADLIEFAPQLGIDLPPINSPIFWIVIHKIRAKERFPVIYRNTSREWLTSKGFNYV